MMMCLMRMMKNECEGNITTHQRKKKKKNRKKKNESGFV